MAESKLHVGFVITSLRGGGAERNMLSLARSLIERGHRADLVVPCLAGDYQDAIPRELGLYRGRFPNTDRKFLRTVQQAGARVTAFGVSPISVARIGLALARRHPGIRIRRQRSLYASVHVLSRYIRKVRPHVLVSALEGADAAMVCAAELTGRAVPTVVTVRNNVAAGYEPQWRTVARTLYPLADAVVGVSQGVSESVWRSLGLNIKRQVHVIHNGVPVDRVRRLAEEGVAHPWFGKGEPPVILSVGREAPQKDYPTLVAAFGRARREVDARLLVLGRLSPRYRARLESLAADHGVERDVGFVDFDENPYRYMRRAALLALSSRWEGLPTVIIEALACGTPVVSTDTPYGPRELLGQWGELPPVGDAPALGRAMVASLRGARPTEEALWARAADFSDETSADAYVALFRKLVKDRGR